MKHGLKKFNGLTQGARAVQGQKVGEQFIASILKILNLVNLKEIKIKAKNYYAIVNNIECFMSPDFIINATNHSKKIFNKNIEYIFIESKFKQIAGSDWEKIESNFGYHEYFYNKLCHENIKTIVVLSGFWKQLQKNYFHFMNYFKEKYGENCIFDFGNSYTEIYRFANLMGVKLTLKLKNKIEEIWRENFENFNN